MKKRYLLYFTIIITLLLLVILSALFVRDLTSRNNNYDVEIPISTPIKESNVVSLAVPDLGQNENKKLEFSFGELPFDTKITSEKGTATFKNNNFELIIFLSMGERGGLFEGMIDKTSIQSTLANNIDRYTSTTELYDMKNVLSNEYINYYFYTNTYAQCAYEVSFCGVMEVTLETTDQLEYDAHMTAYCNTDAESVKYCDQIIKSLTLKE